MAKSLLIVTVLFTVILFVGNSFAQDATVVDPDHYKVEFENEKVRVLRITYGPGEKSVMHYHPDAVAVFLTDNNVQFTLPDGKSIDVTNMMGDAVWTTEGEHLPENIGDKSSELILVELK